MTCCVGMCCRESSWLGVRRMLSNEGLAIAGMQEHMHMHMLLPTALSTTHSYTTCHAATTPYLQKRIKF